MHHSRFKGVAGLFQTGTTSTFGREVNWKSMGASVDRSDLGLWAIITSIRWLANTRRETESLELVETERVDPYHTNTHLFTTRHELFDSVVRVERRKKVGFADNDALWPTQK